jgi:hypothetical protein
VNRLGEILRQLWKLFCKIGYRSSPYFWATFIIPRKSNVLISSKNYLGQHFGRFLSFKSHGHPARCLKWVGRSSQRENVFWVQLKFSTSVITGIFFLSFLFFSFLWQFSWLDVDEFKGENATYLNLF